MTGNCSPWYALALLPVLSGGAAKGIGSVAGKAVGPYTDEAIELARKSGALDEGAEIIFIKGSDSLKNLTPKLSDVMDGSGLSAWNTIEAMSQNMEMGPKDSIQLLNLSKLSDNIKVVLDNNPPGHVTLSIDGFKNMVEWASTKKVPDKFHWASQAIQDAIPFKIKWRKLME